MKELPQRVLAVKLRTAIDRAMRHPSPRWRFQVWWLIENNPRGAASSHVAHNLGAARRVWLARFVTNQGRTSLGRTTVIKISSLPPEEQAEWHDYLRRKIEMVRKHHVETIAPQEGAEWTTESLCSYCMHKAKFHDTMGCREYHCSCRSFTLPTVVRGDAVPEKKG